MLCMVASTGKVHDCAVRLNSLSSLTGVDLLVSIPTNCVWIDQVCVRWPVRDQHLSLWNFCLVTLFDPLAAPNQIDEAVRQGAPLHWQLACILGKLDSFAQFSGFCCDHPRSTTSTRQQSIHQTPPTTHNSLPHLRIAIRYVEAWTAPARPRPMQLRFSGHLMLDASLQSPLQGPSGVL